MKRTSSLFLFIGVLVFLTGCAPSDEKIATAVSAALSANPSLSAISSSVKDGIVTLTGEVETDELRTLAEVASPE